MKKIILTSSHAFKTWNNLTLCEKDNINLISGLQSLENSFCKATRIVSWSMVHLHKAVSPTKLGSGNHARPVPGSGTKHGC
jgi:hypothetical protein